MSQKSQASPKEIKRLAKEREALRRREQKAADAMKRAFQK
jgi:hypothetical protein